MESRNADIIVPTYRYAVIIGVDDYSRSKFEENPPFKDLPICGLDTRSVYSYFEALGFNKIDTNALTSGKL